ncbi:uncharacterized protein N7469_010131 [Penicillium citrinum]|uniref:peptidylprolyl isomerase n=1 Tax=Penicillium citrinum TaxID=5077 RepID=A0A9W9NM88_PENCI|nr:uncharacterized protein N7469_010131 [Penicillium citrinum]KAJ5221244.1 hypothetical protein N7469_010131 [Penicillium citrinum]
MLSTPSRHRGTPALSRPTPRARGQSTPRGSTAPDLPAYEFPEAPLNRESQQQIISLLESQQLRDIKDHFRKAANHLTDSAGQVNARLCDARSRYQTQKERRRNTGEEGEIADDEDEEIQRLAESERKVDDITGRMEERMRRLIDSESHLIDLTDSLSKIEKDEADAQASLIRGRQTRAQRRIQEAQQQHNQDEDGEDDSQDDDYEGTPEREARERNTQNPPSRRLDESLGTGAQKWDGLSLTERYASNNSYIGFYRTVHDSKFNGDEAPPLPASSTWFSHLEDTNGDGVSTSQGDGSSRQTRRTRNQREASPADSDDIAIERERVSLRCPLTLLPFRDPVTSTKCPHTFEREAIMDMISRSNLFTPNAQGRGRRLRAAKCPVCSNLLATEDLRADPVMLRKIRRAEELQAREEDDQMGGLGKEEGGNEVTLGSDEESGGG